MYRNTFCNERAATRRRSCFRCVAVLACTIVLIGWGTNAVAQLNQALPTQLEDVGVDEHLNATLPLDLTFVDSTTRQPVQLRDCFKDGRPVILTMNYSNCPMLCSLQLNGLFDGLSKMEWGLGDKFDMITVSIDPTESSERAQLTKQKYLKIYGRGSASAYHCLTGKEAAIKQLASVVGFKYRYAEESRQYIHAAVTMICTPDGRVSRYLYGVEYTAQTLKFALLEASEGKIGNTVDQVLLFCFHYDAESGKYGPSGFRLMQLGGVFTVFVIGGVLLIFWRREKKPKPSQDDQQTENEVPRTNDTNESPP